MQMTALDQWYDHLKSHDPGALWNLLHPDAVFESPVVHSPQRGREITFKYLTAALNVLGGWLSSTRDRRRCSASCTPQASGTPRPLVCAS